jgi:hypothetical protein
MSLAQRWNASVAFAQKKQNTALHRLQKKLNPDDIDLEFCEGVSEYHGSSDI